MSREYYIKEMSVLDMNRLFLLIESTWHARLALFAALDGELGVPLVADIEACVPPGVLRCEDAAGGGEHC